MIPLRAMIPYIIWIRIAFFFVTSIAGDLIDTLNMCLFGPYFPLPSLSALPSPSIHADQRNPFERRISNQMINCNHYTAHPPIHPSIHPI